MNFWTWFWAESTLARTRTKMRCEMHYCVSTCEKHEWVLNRSHNWWSSPVQSIERRTASLSTFISVQWSCELILVRPKPENGRQSVISESLNGCQLKHALPTHSCAIVTPNRSIPSGMCPERFRMVNRKVRNRWEVCTAVSVSCQGMWREAWMHTWYVGRNPTRRE